MNKTRDCHYLILELHERDDERYVRIWGAFHKKHKRFAKRTYRNLKRHCGSVGQYVWVKVKENETN